MGKKGDLLRAQKAQTKVYTFTAAQLEEHDKFIIKEHSEKLKAAAHDAVQEEWDKREQIFDKENFSGNFMTLISMLLAVSSRVLVEKFGWTPISKDRYFNKNMKLAKFGDAIVDEINAICMDEQADIRNYVDETYDLYGVRFIQEEE